MHFNDILYIILYLKYQCQSRESVHNIFYISMSLKFIIYILFCQNVFKNFLILLKKIDIFI